MTDDDPDRLTPGHREDQELITNVAPQPPWSVHTAGVLGVTAAGMYVANALLTPVGVPDAYDGVTVVTSSTIGLAVIFAVLLAVTVSTLWLTPGRRRGPKLVLAWFLAAGCITSGMGLGTLPLIVSTIFFSIPASTPYYTPPEAR